MHTFRPFRLYIFALLSLCICGHLALADEVTGSLIIYPKFDIRQDTKTEFRVVNNSDEEAVFYYNYVCPGVPRSNQFCAKLDRRVRLTPHQTSAIDVASQNPPCNQGFVIGYPINSQGQAISFNFLSGSYNIISGRRQGSENAVAIQSVKPTGSVLGGLQGFSFVAGPNQDFETLNPLLLTDFKATQLTPETAQTKLVLLDVGAALGKQNPISNVSLDFWSASEQPFSSSLEFVCWTELSLEHIDANFLNENLGTNYGSIKLDAQLTCPVPGACPPYAERAPLLVGAILEDNEASLRKLSGKACNDNDPVTQDSFDPFKGCSFLNISPCGNCDDSNICTADSCDAQSRSCLHKPSVVACNDNNKCTLDSCNVANSSCGHLSINCDDNNACTIDSCDSATGCNFSTVSCDDNNPCTIDSCDAVKGCVHVGRNCSDSNACTRDSCDVSSGQCVNTVISCTDANPCTVDTCNAVNGCINTPKLCNDSNICTTDSCDTATGQCIFTNAGNCGA